MLKFTIPITSLMFLYFYMKPQIDIFMSSLETISNNLN